MNVNYLILRQLRSQTLYRALNIRSLNTQSLKVVKKLFISQSNLLERCGLNDESVRFSHSNLPRRKRGFVWQGRKEDQDYDKSGLLVAFYYNLFLVFVLFVYYWKQGLFSV